MKTKDILTPAEVREQADAWYRRQVDVLKKCHGPRWTDHEPWITEYLKGELRQRLLALGWVPKR